jgi:phosphate-selective porin
MSYIDAWVEELERGQSYRFADWPNQKVPRVAAGVYTVWRGAKFLYVGISGENVTGVSDGSKAKGLFERLNSHALGHRGNDQFCVLVCPPYRACFGEGGPG